MTEPGSMIAAALIAAIILGLSALFPDHGENP